MGKKKILNWSDSITTEMAKFIVGTSGFLYEECLNKASRESMEEIINALFESEDFELAINSEGKITLTCHEDFLDGMSEMFLTELITREFYYRKNDEDFAEAVSYGSETMEKEDVLDFAEGAVAWWSRCLPELKKAVSLVEKQIKFYQKKIKENQ